MPQSSLFDVSHAFNATFDHRNRSGQNLGGKNSEIFIQHRHSHTLEETPLRVQKGKRASSRGKSRPDVSHFSKNSYFNFSKISNQKMKNLDSESIRVLNDLKRKLKVASNEELVKKIERIHSKYPKFEKFVTALAKLAKELNFSKYHDIDLKESPKILWKWIKSFFIEYMEVKQREEKYINIIKELRAERLINTEKPNNDQIPENQILGDFLRKLRCVLGKKDQSNPEELKNNEENETENLIKNCKIFLEEFIDLKFNFENLTKLKIKILTFFGLSEKMSANDVIETLEKIELMNEVQK